MLVHHRGCNGEMQRRRSAVIQWLWIELCFDRWGVINNPQMRTAREEAKVAWMLWRRRMMQKIRRSDCAARRAAGMNSRLPCQDRHIPRGDAVLQLANAFGVIGRVPRLTLTTAALTVIARLPNVADVQ